MSSLLKTESKMKPLNLRNVNRKVKVYDVEKKELIREYDSMNQAREELGVKNISNYIRLKVKCHKNNLGITICFR
jgi:hypothetical protein